jgi:glycosyltransferase involved in cell wall biosynthesis
MVRALWLIPPGAMQFASGEDPEQGLLDCHLASVRLRTAVAAFEWKRCGNQNHFCDPGAIDAGQSVDWKITTICVVPKYYHDLPLQLWLDACAAARSSGCRLAIDICDYPFKKSPAVQAFYSQVLKICDAVVVNSERMAEMIAPHTRHHPLVIEDAILGETGIPEFAPGQRLELLWFGHRSNLHYLDACLEGLARLARQRRCRLTIVTQGGPGAEEWTHDIQARFAFAFEAQFIPWSLEAMPDALRACDLVLIPSDPSDSFKAGASANRIAEALNAGRFPVASPLPSYLSFAEAAWLGQDLVQGIEWALANRAEVLSRIRRGQALVAEKFAADKIARQWRELFENLVSLPNG